MRTLTEGLANVYKTDFCAVGMGVGPRTIRVYRILFIAVVMVGAMVKLEIDRYFKDGK